MQNNTSQFAEAAAAGIHSNVTRILSTRTDVAGKKVVDLACGDGRTTHMLRQMGAEVQPYDIFPENCKLPDTPGYIDLQQPFPIPDNSVDMVVLQEVLEHLPNQAFALAEIARILKPGGELFLTTPTRSSLISKIAHLGFESENLRAAPEGESSGVWLDKKDGRKYFGHLFLIGVQQLRALALIGGFKSMRVHRSELSKSSAWLFPLLYPFVVFTSYRAMKRGQRKAKNSGHANEVREQFRLNIDPKVLTNKYLIASLTK